MKFLLGISIVFCIFLSHGEAATCREFSIFKVCYESNIITQMLLKPAEKDIPSISAWLIQRSLSLTPDGRYDFHAPSIWVRTADADYDSPEPISLYFYGTQFGNETKLPLSKLGMLMLVKNGLTEVPTDWFSNVDLRDLHIENNPITVIRANAFSPLKNLKRLTLENNNITTLEPGCFNGLERLEYLELKFNKFILTPGIFSPLKGLSSLDIVNSTAVGGFDAQAFKVLPNLNKLKILVDHEITLEPGMFDDNSKLSTIDLENNKFRHIPINIFNNLTSRVYLNLRNNVIESIERGAFSGILSHLNLDNAYKGGIIHTGTFNTVNEYFENREVILTSNELVEIRPRAFEGFRVIVLDISRNNITKIVAETFTGIYARQIILRDNPIVHIEPDAFKNATIGSLIVNPDSIIAQNRSYWGIPDSISIYNNPEDDHIERS